jgi:hypothetical protein
VTTIDVPGAQFTNPIGINSARQVVGQYGDATGFIHGFLGERGGFLWEDGSFTIIDVPFGTQTAVHGITPSGTLVGSYVDPERTTGVEAALRGFVLRP